MSITLYKTDPTKLNQAIVVQDGTVNDTAASLTFIGKGAPSFGIAVNEDFLYLLENFANSTPPLNPTEGQLWYDTSNDALTGKKVKVFDSTIWKPVNGIWQQASQPSGSVDPGDIWVDTTRSQLYITQNGSSWTLIGPTYSSTLKTGSYAETVLDNAGGSHNIIKNYINDQVIEVISSDTFYPQPPIYGFDQLQPGLNLSNIYSGQLNSNAKTASALLLTNGTSVSGSSFVRTDVDSTINATLYVSQVSVGASSLTGSSTPWILNQTNGYQANITNPVAGGTINFIANSPTSVPQRIVTIDGSANGVGINLGNTSPQAPLDVNGNVIVRQLLSLTSATNSLAVTGQSLFNNTLTVTSDTVLDDVYTSGTTYFGTSTVALLPEGTGNSSPTIGTQYNPFGTVWARSFSGPPIAGGTVTGTNAVGSLLVNITKGSIATGDPFYFVPTIINTTASTIVPVTNLITINTTTAISNGNIYNIAVGQPVVITLTTSSFTVTGAVISTDGSRPNQLICNDTSVLTPGMSIVFQTIPLGSGLTVGTVYFIQRVVDGTHFTISSTWLGSLAVTIGASTTGNTCPAILGSFYGGLTAGTTYYIQSISGTSIRLSTSYNGSPISISTGTTAFPGNVVFSIGGTAGIGAGYGINNLYYVAQVLTNSNPYQITLATSSGNALNGITTSLTSNVNLTNVGFNAGTGVEFTFNGNLTGNASGLTNSAVWKLQGQITSPGFNYYGQPASTTFADGTQGFSFSTTLDPTAITSQTAVTSVASTATLLVAQNGTLNQISKSNLLSDIYSGVVPTGALIPFAGLTSKVPSGWLLCDGSLVDSTEADGIYETLFQTIGYLYGKGSVSTQFRLPDMRSRVPMGYDDMNNYPNLSGTTPSNVAGLTGNLTPNQTLAQTFAVGVPDVAGEVASSGTNGIYYQALNYIIKI